MKVFQLSNKEFIVEIIDSFKLSNDVIIAFIESGDGKLPDSTILENHQHKKWKIKRYLQTTNSIDGYEKIKQQEMKNIFQYELEGIHHTDKPAIGDRLITMKDVLQQVVHQKRTSCSLRESRHFISSKQYVQIMSHGCRNINLIILPFLLLFLFSCASFDKEFYERVTDIKFPKNIEIIETYDNGEFYTCSSFRIDSLTLRKFIGDYKFEPLKKIYPSQFLGIHSLKKELPDFDNFHNKFFVTGTKAKNSWIYIVDLDKSILWAEVQYPDMAGN